VVIAAALFLLRPRFKGRLAAPLLLVGMMFLVILPWSFYNLATRGEFILINDAGGYALWLGNHEANLRMYEGDFAGLKENQEYQENVSKTLTAKQIDEWNVSKGYSELSLKDREALWRDQAIENARAHPLGAIRLGAWKLWGYWKPNLNSDVYGQKAAIGSGLFMITLYVFGFIGALVTLRDIRTRKVFWLMLTVAVFVTLVHVLIVSNLRLRIPYIDPWLMLFTGSGIAAIVEKVFGKKRIDGNNGLIGF
jgi:hypothetical protein